jgi:hypothetical protein
MGCAPPLAGASSDGAAVGAIDPGLLGVFAGGTTSVAIGTGLGIDEGLGALGSGALEPELGRLATGVVVVCDGPGASGIVSAPPDSLGEQDTPQAATSATSGIDRRGARREDEKGRALIDGSWVERD